MKRARPPLWSANELAVLRDVYPAGGVDAVHATLPHRPRQAIFVKANRLGLHRLPGLSNAKAPRPALKDGDLEQAIQLREQQGWSFARIAERFSVSESSASNAVLIALCTRKGFTPAQRDDNGFLTEEGRERIRYALKKGLKGAEIQLRLGVSASCVAEQRRRYNRDLKARGKALLPPPGRGERYSGRRIPRAKKEEIEALYMQGLGALHISRRTGCSTSVCKKVRDRLVKRLRRTGQALPGCDLDGVRRVQAVSAMFVPAESSAALRRMLLEATPVRTAARILALGNSSAYRIRDELAAELAERGESLPKPDRSACRPGSATADPYWPPLGAREIYAFRAMLADMQFDEAKAAWRGRKREEHRAEASRPKTFSEQLDRVRRGEIGIAPALARRHLETTQLPPEQRPLA